MSSAISPRRSARVLAVDPLDRVLLLVVRTYDGGTALLTPGGGIESGETPVVAAARELREETGIDLTVDDLRGPLHQGPVRLRDVHGDGQRPWATFYAAAVSDCAVSFAGHTADEVGFIVGHEWVDPDTLATDARVRSRLLPDLAVRAVAAVRRPRGSHLRVTARVLPVDPAGAVLLLHEQDPALPGEHYWSSIGGGCDPGESPATAAVRELAEETGIRVDEERLVGPVLSEERAYTWGGVDHVGFHHYFAVAMEHDVTVSLDGLEPEEVGNVLGAGWWGPDALAAGPVSRPDILPEIMRTAVAAVEGIR